MADSQPGGFPSTCVDAATVAAFVDGVLDPASRARVVAHVATCEDCAELVGEVIRTNDELPVASKGKVLWMRSRGLAAVGGVAAIAASILLFVVNRGAALDPVIAAVGDNRPILARPSGGFHYGPLRSPMRGSSAGSDDLALAAAVARLRERATQTNAAGDLHASGVAELVAGNTAGAIDALQAARRLEPDDARVIADLGAAYMTRFVERGDQADANAAVDAFDTALARSPSLKEAWFNKALLLERMNRPAEALTAWSSYLELSDERGWREEATRNRDDLQRRLR
jgi:anti-sigma factor RsiW